MRNLSDIIEAVKDGEKPDYDELRYALLVVDSIGIMTQSMILGLYGKSGLSQFDKFKIDNNYKTRRKAYESDPKKYIGSFDPDLPGYQEDRARSKRVYDGIMRKIETDNEKKCDEVIIDSNTTAKILNPDSSKQFTSFIRGINEVFGVAKPAEYDGRDKK